jgi:hypothetical protein
MPSNVSLPSTGGGRQWRGNEGEAPAPIASASPPQRSPCWRFPCYLPLPSQIVVDATSLGPARMRNLLL